MYQNNEDLIIIDNFKKLFRRKRPVNTGDIGVYQDVLTVKTNNVETSSLYYDIFVKVRAKVIFQDLIEIEVIDVFTINASNQNITDLINGNIPKYINPKHVKWEEKNQTT